MPWYFNYIVLKQQWAFNNQGFCWALCLLLLADLENKKTDLISGYQQVRLEE